MFHEIFPEQSSPGNRFPENGGCAIQKFRKVSNCHILRYENNMCKDNFIIFLVFFEVFW